MRLEPPLCANGSPAKDAATFEHLKQRCHGGTNRKSNIALACWSCNKDRPNQSDWMTYKSYKMGEISSKEMTIICKTAREDNKRGFIPAKEQGTHMANKAKAILERVCQWEVEFTA